MNTQWRYSRPEFLLAQTLSRELKISPLVAQVLIGRGVGSLAEAEQFLNPRLSNLHDPMEIPGMEEAVRRVLAAKERGEQVVVFGDYDVDGITGTAILLHLLKYLNISNSYYIPHRYDEGYGLSEEAVRKIAREGGKLLVTVDCGVANYREVELANELGLEVVVTDHHNIPKVLPSAFAVVNPKMIKGEHPSKNLSGAGVAFKFAWALFKAVGIKDSAFLTDQLDLAALGTISDVVPLIGENRIIAASGLNLINQRKRVGIKNLAEVAAISGRINTEQINFGIAPRLNAAGRLEHASKSVELLMADDPAFAEELARELHRINARRQDIGSTIREEVFSRLTQSYISNNKLILLAGENWHPGVIGIVASKVVDSYYRPTVLLGVSEGIGRGSARSIQGVNIFNLLESCRDLFLDFGGHEGAAGFEIKEEDIPELEKRLRVMAEERIKNEDMQIKINIDAEINPAGLTLGIIEELKILEPHGEGNPLPIFMSGNLQLKDLRQVGNKGQHIKLKLSDGKSVFEAIGFGMGELAKDIVPGEHYDIAYNLESNEWNGFETVQLSLVDVRKTEGAV